jgi:hypothetical protein
MSHLRAVLDNQFEVLPSAAAEIHIAQKSPPTFRGSVAGSSCDDPKLAADMTEAPGT